MATILGIDLGTTNSAGAYWHDGAPHIIPDAEGRNLTPSVVAWDADTRNWAVGYPARDIAAGNPDAAIYSIKRLIGRRYETKTIQDDLQDLRILYEIAESRQWKSRIEVTLKDKRLTPEQISAMILLKIKKDAEAYLNEEITQAIITVPAYFHASQREATRDAGRIANLEVLQIVNEPTAACLRFGYERLNEPTRLVAVYDLGGGTFDISVLEMGQGPFYVRSTNGDTHLGGDDIDWAIVDWMLSELGQEERNDLKEDVVALSRLRIAAERAKIILSDRQSAQIEVSGLLSPKFSLHDVSVELTQAQLVTLSSSFIARTLECCQRALTDAKLRASDIEEVLLVGGQTRMPAIREAVQGFFGMKPKNSDKPEEDVALGAAVQAGILVGDAPGRLSNVTPLSLGVGNQGLIDVLIERNTHVPYKITKEYTTATDYQENVEIRVYQGEKPKENDPDNVKLAQFILPRIEPAPKGVPKINVTFQVDSDNILHVVAEDAHTGNVKEVTITDTIRLSDEEIERMIRDAEQHAAEYEKQRRQIVAQRKANDRAESLSELLSDQELVLEEELMARIRDALAVTTVDDWVSHQEHLESLWMETREIRQKKNRK